MPSGRVAPRKLGDKELAPFQGFHPGKLTIDLLELNNSKLLVARGKAQEEFRLRYFNLLIQDHPMMGEEVRKLLSDSQPFAAALRGKFELMRQELVPADERRIKRSASVSTIKTLDPPTCEPLHLTSIRMRNFRAIEDVELDFAKNWKVLLGENATGKSTVLQPVACALMGEEYVAKHYKNGRSWLTRKRGKRAPKGELEIQLDRGEPIRIEYSAESIRLISGGKPVPTFLRAYGTVRIPASRRQFVKPPLQSVRNLFDPHFPLTNAIRWLKSLEDDDRKPMKVGVRDMLLLDDGAVVDFKNGRFSVDLHGERFTSDELSAGHQDVFNLVADIISGFPLRFSDMAEAFGIVWLDEIGAHLHPRWKMRIVTSLKKAFPKLQFLVSTHDPLCLRGLEDDEVVVMSRDSEGVHARTQFPRSPRYMQVDQLLTSAYFGLQSTVDSSLDASCREYQGLLVQSSLTPNEIRRRNELKNQLDEVSAFGVTRRDQLLCEILDEFLAKETKPSAPSSTIPEDLKRAVWKRWKEGEAEE